jgi:hypothetical protein
VRFVHGMVSTLRMANDRRKPASAGYNQPAYAGRSPNIIVPL